MIRRKSYHSKRKKNNPIRNAIALPSRSWIPSLSGYLLVSWPMFPQRWHFHVSRNMEKLEFQFGTHANPRAFFIPSHSLGASSRPSSRVRILALSNISIPNGLENHMVHMAPMVSNKSYNIYLVHNHQQPSKIIIITPLVGTM